MALVGYETDQVMRTPEGDVPVPITWAYNHHFVAYMSGAYSELQQLQGEELKNPGMASHGAQATYMTLKAELDGQPAPVAAAPAVSAPPVLIPSRP